MTLTVGIERESEPAFLACKLDKTLRLRFQNCPDYIWRSGYRQARRNSWDLPFKEVEGVVAFLGEVFTDFARRFRGVVV